ncbi:MAG: hypothetical protein IIA91_06510 [Chloroflexi bacterium]|nr:hypothetical protein [Chloroflexota bacterium]
METPVVLSRTDRALISESRPSKRLQFKALQETQLKTPPRQGKAERMLASPAWLARRQRFRDVQMAQIDGTSVLAAADRILLVGTERRSIPQTGLDKRHRILALQQAQLEAPAVLGKAERVLLGQDQPYQRQRFRANQMAQLSAPSVMGETERMLLIGARISGWRRPLRALREAVTASLAYAQSQLKMRRPADQSEEIAAVEGTAVAAGPAETPAAAIASATEPEQGTATDVPAAPPAAAAPTEAARILAKAFGREDLAGQLSIVTAALTEVGAPRDEFGLVLKVGSMAPKTRAGASEFTVKGLGLAELSHGLSRWLKEVDKTDVPLQVIDDGSGKIKVLIS